MHRPTQDMFSGTPLVLGSVIGFRGFNFWYGHNNYRDVIVYSPYRRTEWTPGENAAACVTWRKVAEGVGGQEYAKVDVEHTNTLSYQECSCGFYAYFRDGFWGGNAKWALGAIIEGYGMTTLGSEGFRCQNAKILALSMFPSVQRRFPKVKGLIEEKYQVPVFSSRPQMYKEFPMTRRRDVA